MEGISIIIPNYNKEKYIEKCVNSVLEQSYMPKEIIIVELSKNWQGKMKL